VEFVIKMESLTSLSHDFVVPQNAPAPAVVEDVVRFPAGLDGVETNFLVPHNVNEQARRPLAPRYNLLRTASSVITLSGTPVGRTNSRPLTLTVYGRDFFQNFVRRCFLLLSSYIVLAIDIVNI
jgi:hypothetical protein